MSVYFDEVKTASFFTELESIMKEAGMFEWAGKKVHKAGTEAAKKLKEEKDIMRKVMREMNKDKKTKKRIGGHLKHLGVA